MSRAVTTLISTFAPLVARTRELTPYPGWRFDVEWTRSDLPHRLRRRLWLYCHTRRTECPVVMRWHHGARVFVYLGNDMSKQLFVAGCIEPNELAFADRFLQPGMTVLDIGANDGLYTLLASKRVGQTGRVLSFEPSRREFARLQANISLNRLRNVETHQAAVFRDDAQLDLRIADFEHTGHNTLGGFAYASTEHIRTEKVDALRLDTITQQQGVMRLDLIKIDAEGAELSILQGGLQTLRQFRPVLLMELNEASLTQQGSSSNQVVELLQSCGYVVYNFDDVTGLPALGAGKPYSPDIVAAPVGHELELR